MVVGMLATSLFRVPRVVVRLRQEEHAEGFSLLSHDRPAEHVRVNPEAAAVERIVSLLEVPGAVDVVSFMDGRLLVAGFPISASSDFAGLTLAHINLLFPSTPMLVTAIKRGVTWIVPHGEAEIHPGDLVYFAIAREELENVLSLIGVLHENRQQVMLAGSGRIAIALAHRLEAKNPNVRLIEEDAEQAKHAAAILSNTRVIHGPVTDRKVLEEEEIERVSTFVALTSDHEVNLVSSLLAKRLGAHRAFALVDNPALVNLIGEVGIDAVISPRQLAIELTLQHIRRGRIRAVATLLEDKVEVLEVEAVAGSRITSGSLAQVRLPRGVIVAALLRADRLLVPRGSDRIEPGDQLVVITTAEQAAQLDTFLSR
jgi:trk system potassium uptake protein TrkA